MIDSKELKKYLATLGNDDYNVFVTCAELAYGLSKFLDEE
jgi:hypothetical protein